MGACGVAFMMRGIPHNWEEARKEFKELIQHDVDLRVRPVEGGGKLLLHGMRGSDAAPRGLHRMAGDCVAEPWEQACWYGSILVAMHTFLLLQGPKGVGVFLWLLACTRCALRYNDLQL